MQTKEEIVKQFWPVQTVNSYIPEPTLEWIQNYGKITGEVAFGGGDPDRCIIAVIFPCQDPVNVFTSALDEGWAVCMDPKADRSNDSRYTDILHWYQEDKYLSLYILTQDQQVYRLLLMKVPDAQVWAAATEDMTIMAINDPFYREIFQDDNERQYMFDLILRRNYYHYERKDDEPESAATED